MANREELKAKYGDEEVLVVPLKVIEELGLNKEGYNSKCPVDMLVLVAKLEKHSYYIPRYLSDDNPEEVELIAYITFGDTFEDGDRNFFTYKRIKNGDSRGDGAFSVGVGGHINPVDLKGNMELTSPVMASALREVEEEVGAELDDTDLVYEGFIRCTKSAYDRDHLGIHLNVSLGVLGVEEVNSMLPLGQLTHRALKELFYSNLENWSRIIVDNTGGNINEKTRF